MLSSIPVVNRGSPVLRKSHDEKGVNELMSSGNAGYNLSKAGVKVFTEQRESPLLYIISYTGAEMQSRTSLEVFPQTVLPIFSCTSPTLAISSTDKQPRMGMDPSSRRFKR